MHMLRGGRRKRENFTRSNTSARSETVAAWVSAIAAAITIPIALYAVWESHLATIAVREEFVAIDVRHLSDRPLEFAVSYLPYHSLRATTTWRMVISNLGERSISVLQLDLYELHANGSPLYAGECELRQLDGSQLELPLDIEQGKSVAVLTRVPVPVGVRAAGIVMTSESGGRGVTWRSAEDAAFREGHVDMFDNSIEPYRNADLFKTYRWFPQSKVPKFEWHLRTSRGTTLKKVVGCDVETM
jgi:hypothetical protein